jgi:hypothetical protein
MEFLLDDLVKDGTANGDERIGKVVIGMVQSRGVDPRTQAEKHTGVGLGEQAEVLAPAEGLGRILVGNLQLSASGSDLRHSFSLVLYGRKAFM